VARARAANGAGLDDLLAADRSALRGRLAVTLAPELEASGGASADVLDALEQATGWDAWRALRDVRGHTAPSAERAMAFTASCLIG
jgi:hypothetical protein